MAMLSRILKHSSIDTNDKNRTIKHEFEHYKQWNIQMCNGVWGCGE